MSKVFISFSEKDRDKASILESRLRKSEYLSYVIVSDGYDDFIAFILQYFNAISYTTWQTVKRKMQRKLSVLFG